ncbi:27989_t:CDS:2 [Dentiscutata erythropus]|uniref:27989_t:CDS:1 n=1 Tax=Dentiscutata erythropus TaxID=1348616 RepID=A0A9N9CRS0_9GLOM|nr:27989_t:CDS:2 [Dentiscutata erythropus]
MHKTNSGFYVIDVLPLHHASKRPFHLERRMKSKRSTTTYVHGHGHKKLPQCDRNDARIKREALLEQRRLKLARQILHVKEVLIKQHERALNESFTKRSHIQQTLQVAEKNRNTILQRLVEQCAQEVARCKEVARQQQLKNQEEIDRRRADLERRQKATAARRARLLSVSKSHVLDSDLPHYTREEAATIIQNNWRFKHLIDVIKTYRSFGITMHTIKKMSFRDSVNLLKENAVIQATNKFLQRVRKSSTVTSGASKYKNPARIFLSAYMIVAHTNEILVDVGRLEKTLLNSSKNMLKELEQWFSEIDNANFNKISYNNLLSFLSSWDAYYKDFNTWKSKDSEKLASNLITHYVELEKLWNTVKNQANAETEWRMNIVEQQEEIRRKIRNLGGDEATAKLERVLRRLKANLPINGSENADVSDSVTGTVNDQTSDHREQDSGLPPRQSFVPQTLATDGSVELNSSNLQPTTSSTNTPSASHKKSTTNVNLNRIIQSLGGTQVNSGLTNEQLAHEIIIDPNFELKPPKLSDLEERVRAMATKAFFDSARDDFNQGRYERWIPELLSDVKQRLLDLVPSTSSLYSSINDVLDIDLITQQTKAGVYNIHNCIVFITNTMLQICAPVRDEEIKELKDLNDLAEIFQKLLNILDQMRLDLTNYRVKAFRPYIKEHAIEYERRKFEQALQSKRLTLDLTKPWIKQTVDSLLRTRAERNPENIHLPQHKHNYGIKFDQVFNESFVSFIFQSSMIGKNNCPETLLLDIERLWNYQNEGQAVTIVAALLMLTKNVVNGKVGNVSDDDLTTLKDTLFVLLTDGDTTIDNLAAEIIAYFPSPLSPETQTLIKSMVSKTLSQSDKVFSLLSRRIQNIVKQHIQTGQFPKKETLAQHGVIAVSKELEQLSRKITILGRYNREVYAYWYDSIIREQLQEAGDADRKEKPSKGKSNENVD